MNFVSQSGQANGFSPVWILRCSFNLPLLLNLLSQSWQTNGFSPVWTLRCTFKWPLRWNFFPQSGQANGFSPVWILRCSFNLPTPFEPLVTIWTDERLFTRVNSTMFFQCTAVYELRVTIWAGKRLFTSVNSTMFIQFATPCWNFLSQSWQANGFSPVWTLRCVFKWLLCWNFFPQSGQANGFSPVWTLRCIIQFVIVRLNLLSQSGQPNGFSPVWIRRWTFKLLLLQNFLSQSRQANGFSPVWILRCLFKFNCVETSCHNLFTCMNSTMNYSVVTIWAGERLFASVNLLRWNFFPQSNFHQCEFYDVHSILLWTSCHNLRQANGFSPVWILLCFFNALLFMNFVSQSGQANGFSPV